MFRRRILSTRLSMRWPRGKSHSAAEAATVGPAAPGLPEQMAPFIIPALGEFDPPAPPTQRFLDVPSSNVFYNFIDRMAVLNITLGCGGGNYCPSQSVTRGQMAAFLVRAFDL